MNKNNKVIDTRNNKFLSIIEEGEDRQSKGIAELETADSEFVENFSQYFAGMDILKNEDKVKEVTRLSNVIKNGKRQYIDNALRMGRALIHTQGILSKAEWEHLLAGFPLLFQLKKSTASMFRNIAKAIDEKRIPRELCPESVSTLYQITTYSDNQLRVALENGIITPELTRAAAISFKKTLLKSDGTPEISKIEDIENKVATLFLKRKKLKESLIKVEEKIERLNKEKETLLSDK